MAIIPPINPILGTTTRFGVPTILGGALAGGVLMPKLKHRFRVYAWGFGDGTSNPSDFTRQIVTCGRPQQQYNNTALHSYNNITYIAQKPEWQTIEITLRDDINNAVSSAVSGQLQKQMNHFTQSAARSHVNYKFIMYLQTLDGTMGEEGNNILEQWNLEGCYIEQVQYDSMDYSSSEPVMITLTVRFDNATQGSEILSSAANAAIPEPP